MPQRRCSNCNQFLIAQQNIPKPCGYCGYLEGMVELVELPEGEPSGPSQFRRLVWWMAVGVVGFAVLGSFWLMLRFQSSLVDMTQSY